MLDLLIAGFIAVVLAGDGVLRHRVRKPIPVSKALWANLLTSARNSGRR